jgi:hypothetical protein
VEADELLDPYLLSPGSAYDDDDFALSVPSTPVAQVPCGSNITTLLQRLLCILNFGVAYITDMELLLRPVHLISPRSSNRAALLPNKTTTSVLSRTSSSSQQLCRIRAPEGPRSSLTVKA